MKALRFFSSLAVSMLVATSLHAGGFGAGAAIGTGGSAAVSGGHAAGISTGGAHVSAASVGHAAISHPGIAGTPHLSGGGLRPIAANNPGAPRYLPGGFTPNVFPHPATANAGLSRGATVSAFSPMGTVPARTAPIAPAARAHNAWTDATVAPYARGGAQNGFTGQTLYPNATHDALGNPYPSSRGGNNGASWGHVHPFRFHGRGYYGPYIYGYPGVFVGGYAPYDYGDTAGIANAASDYAPEAVSPNGVPSPEAQNEPGQPYAPAQMTPPAGDSTVNPPDAAAVPGDQSIQSGNGPDSLVEAVQAELSRRGYFGGKIDSVYNAATHTAIQRFQTDQHLPASGRINEATLHALQLD